MKKIRIFFITGILLATPFFVLAEVSARGDINFVFDDCGGTARFNCTPWLDSEKTLINNFLYSVGKTSPDNSLNGAYQYIKSIIGLPYEGGRFIKLTHDPSSVYNAYYSGSQIVFKGFDVSGISAGDPNKEVLRTFGHELVHAFRGQALMISSFEEGTARMIERLVADQFNLNDSSSIDYFFTNPDQNNDFDMGPAKGNLFNGITVMSGDVYSLEGSTFAKLYLEDKTLWQRFHDEFYKARLSDVSFSWTVSNLFNLLKSLAPAQVEGLPKDIWFANRAAFNYEPTPGPKLVIINDRNSFLYIRYFYRKADGGVSQEIPDSSGLLKTLNPSDIVVSAKYFDAKGSLIKSNSVGASAWGGFFSTERQWIDLTPVDQGTAVKAVVDFKVKSTGLVLSKEVWLASHVPMGINGITSQTFKEIPDKGYVIVSRTDDPYTTYRLNVSNGDFHINDLYGATTLSESFYLESWNGPILIQYFNEVGVKIKERIVNKIKGPLTVFLNNIPLAYKPVIKADFTISLPLSGEQVQVGKPYTIRWISSGTTSSSPTIRIGLYKGNLFKDFITGESANDGEYIWNIPASLPIASDYKITIISWPDSNYYTDSGYFSVVQAVSDQLTVEQLQFQLQYLQNQLLALQTTSTSSPAISTGSTATTSSSVATTATTTIPIYSVSTSTPQSTTGANIATSSTPTTTTSTTTSGKPDLIIYQFSLDPKTETYYKSQPFSLSYILKNIGQKESGQFKFSIKNRTNGWDLGGATFNSLAPGGVWDQTSSWSSLYWASEGYNLIELKVDGDNIIDESNENNNVTTFGILVSASIPPSSTPTTTPSFVATSSSASNTATTTPTSSSNSSSPTTITTTTTVTSPGFVVTTPSSGTSISAGSTYTVRWQYVSNAGNLSTARLSLYQGGSYKDFIAIDVPNNGSYTWTVPNLPGSGYSIRLFNLSYPNDYADSGSFSITAPSASSGQNNVLASVLESMQSLLNNLALSVGNLNK